MTVFTLSEPTGSQWKALVRAFLDLVRFLKGKGGGAGMQGGGGGGREGTFSTDEPDS